MPDFSNLYETLRKEGIDTISKLAKSAWTDHNPSDPGITLLEQLCYALSDLEYRVDFDITDLIAQGGNDAYSVLFSPKEILSGAPVTINDFRKILVDITGIKNADVFVENNPEPQILYAPFSNELLLEKDKDELLSLNLYNTVILRGLWKILIEAEQNTNDETLFRDTLAQMAHDKVQSWRSLCADYTELRILDVQNVSVEIGIEIERGADVSSLMLHIYSAISEYISPSYSFIGIQQMLENTRLEDVFDGPVLEKGFLPQGSINSVTRRKDLRRSDLMHIISNISPEIKTVRYVNFTLDSLETNQKWIVELDPERAATFDISSSSIRFFRGNLEVKFNNGDAISEFNKKENNRINNSAGNEYLDVPIQLGNNRNIGEYISLRDYMPELYGVGPVGLPANAPVYQQASAKQLSAYLLFFEQILANNFSQLENAWKLFSVNRNDIQSYFVQTLDNIPRIDGIYTTEDPIGREDTILKATEDEIVAGERTERFLDHISARFSESMNDYSLLMDSLVQDGMPRTGNNIADKRAFLLDYPALSSKRGTGFNYMTEDPLVDTISGLKHRIGRLLGFDIDLSGNSVNAERFYILEHILFRPRHGDYFQDHPLLGRLENSDPYSLQISFVFSNDLERLSGDNSTDYHKTFKTFVERTIREETPAQINTHIYWMNNEDLIVFENAYKRFLGELLQYSILNTLEDSEHQYRLRIERDYILDLLAQNKENYPVKGVPKPDISEDNTPYGIAYPLRDIPVSENVFVDFDENGQGLIRIFYPQKNVTYVLANRYKELIIPSIEKAGDIPDGEINGIPYVHMLTPLDITEEQTYYIRAEKRSDLSLPYVYLKKRVRVRIGIGDIQVIIPQPEINYGSQATVHLIGTQAGVDYLLFDGDEQITPVSIDGDPLQTISIQTEKIGGFTDDTTIIAKGSQDGTNWENVGSAELRVRANPNLPILVQPAELEYGNMPGIISVESTNENQTQSSVTYTLYSIEINDRLFVHQKNPENRPSEEAMHEIPHSFGTALLQLYTTTNIPDIETAFTEINTQNIQNSGDTVSFNTSSLSLSEDTLYVVVASKQGHDVPVVLHNQSTSFVHMGASLILPNPASVATVDPQPVTSGNRGAVILSSPQPGVKYFLRVGEIDHAPVFYHDIDAQSPRRDGVGFSKIEVDSVSGSPYQAPLTIYTDNILTQNLPNVEVVAEKIQTGMQIVIAEVSFTVS